MKNDYITIPSTIANLLSLFELQWHWKITTRSLDKPLVLR
jgi:hypothetical protein